MSLSKETVDTLDEFFAAVVADRDKIVAFYDARMCFASYCEITSSLGAALIKNKLYTNVEVAHMLGIMIADTLTRESTTRCEYKLGDSAIVGGKQ